MWQSIGATRSGCARTFHNFSTCGNLFSGCIGAVDGIHIKIMKPIDQGSSFYCYKGAYNRDYIMPATDSSKKVVMAPGNSGVIRKTVQPKSKFPVTSF